MSADPECRLCGQPSPYGDPCEACQEIERILAMTDEEVLASITLEELGHARGFKEGLRIGLAALKHESAAKAELLEALEYWMGREEHLPDFTVDDVVFRTKSLEAIARATGSPNPLPNPDNQMPGGRVK